MGEDHFYHTWGKTVVGMGRKFGKSFTIWNESKERLEKAGFEDVVEVQYKWPMNGWSEDKKLKNIGRWNQLRLHEGIEGFMIRLLTQVEGWSIARAQVFLAEMRRELKNYKVHAYLPGCVDLLLFPPLDASANHAQDGCVWKKAVAFMNSTLLTCMTDDHDGLRESLMI